MHNLRLWLRIYLLAKLKWKSSVSTCVVSCKSRSISLPLLLLLSVRMKLLMVAAAAVLAVASCARVSLEDLEFHSWKLKFGEWGYHTGFFYCGLWTQKMAFIAQYSRSCSASYLGGVQLIHSHTTYISKGTLNGICIPACLTFTACVVLFTYKREKIKWKILNDS